MGRKSFTESQDSSNFAAGIADQNYSNLNSSDDENHAADLGPLDKNEESKSIPSATSADTL